MDTDPPGASDIARFTDFFPSWPGLSRPSTSCCFCCAFHASEPCRPRFKPVATPYVERREQGLP